ncbi:MAG: IS21 family transposase [Anaerolineae bacterium]|nr:IS21 family transposase [Anaerolineae bacterium]
MTTTDAQVRIMMRERKKGRTQEQAAASANVRSRKTVAKYERLEQLPGELVQPRQYRTRQDVLVEDWPTLEAMLQAAPQLEAKTLFTWLCEQHPGKYAEGQLRTLQRRVAQWRALNQEQVAVLEQIHRPGEVLQTDGVWLTELGITIQGIALPHLLIHSVLPYSNWEWGVIAQSESLNALRNGVQSTVQQLGAVPQYHQTDNGSAATCRPGTAAGTGTGGRAYTEGYLQLLNHYGMQPRTTHRRSPQENGDVEGSNGGLKRALEQQLLLRGSRDFATLTDYEAFVQRVLQQRNQARQARLAEELAVMRPLPATLLINHTHQRVRVARTSLIRVQNNAYSVPTSLIGQYVNVHIHEWHLEVYYQSRCVLQVPRLIGTHQHRINYRHVIGSLLRKPGGFRDYRYRDALFPTLVFQQAWEYLQQVHAPRKADLIYLRILHLAAQHLEADVAAALTCLLAAPTPWDDTTVAELVQPPRPETPTLAPLAVDLQPYDQLLLEVAHGA